MSWLERLKSPWQNAHQSSMTRGERGLYLLAGLLTAAVPFVGGLLLFNYAGDKNGQFAEMEWPVRFLSVALIFAAIVGLLTVSTFRLRQAKRMGGGAIVASLVVINAGLAVMLATPTRDASPTSAWFVAGAAWTTFFAMLYLGVTYMIEEWISGRAKTQGGVNC